MYNLKAKVAFTVLLMVFDVTLIIDNFSQKNYGTSAFWGIAMLIKGINIIRM